MDFKNKEALENGHEAASDKKSIELQNFWNAITHSHSDENKDNN